MRPTAEQRHRVELAVSVGLSVDMISAAMETPRRTVYRHFANEIATGRAKRLLANAVRLDKAASEGGAAGSHSSTMLLLDEPTNHLDADSLGWLREFLRGHTGGLVVISHNVELLADVVNRVWFLDAVRGEADVYNMGWQKYIDARATDEQRRRRERANA